MYSFENGAHVVLLGNQKGGSGKSTLAMHIAVALLQSGQRVTTIDLDYEQRTLTRYIENRRITASDERSMLKLPDHICIDDLSHRGTKWSDNDRINALSEVLRSYQPVSDFILIDTPGNGGPLTVFAHGLADTVITPVNDSFVDLDVIFSMGPTPDKTLKPSRYAETIQKAFEARRAVSKRDPDWIVVRNRISPLSSRNERGVVQALETLAKRGSFRATSGLVERVVYREFFPLGLTTFDSFATSHVGVKPNVSHVLARLEVRQLIATLGLPLSETDEAVAAPSIAEAGDTPVAGDLRQLVIPEQQ
ncbi:MAG: division plane positioning ATPase MipZ [Xanthobacteraceae bacterium]|nr:division plane positioning ATPase MipZ [Xanthobacteraceae bacterium]